MARITKLTAEQEALLPKIRDEWISHGLSTEPADRAGAEAGVRLAYQSAGLEPPQFMIWLRSPLEGVYGGDIAGPLIDAAITATTGQVRGQVWDQVGDQVRGQVWDQVGDQVWDQVWDQVRDQVWDQVWDQVGGQVWDQVWDQVRGQVGGQVWDQVRGQVGGQVRGQVRDQVRDQVRGQVWDQVGDQVGDQVWDQVWDQVRDQVRGQVWDQVRDQVWDQVRGQVGGQVWGQHDAHLYSWFDAAQQIGVTGVEPARGLMQVGKCAGSWWPFRGFAILTERPSKLHRDNQGRLHNEHGPALQYPDGFAVYAWHGTRVPADLINNGWGIDQILKERNSEIRRCAIERLGWDQFEHHLILVSECEDPGNPGQTLRLMDLPNELRDMYDAEARLLLCTNGTVEPDGTRRRFGLPVPAHHTDPVVAVAEMYDWPVEAYRRLARRA